LVSASITAYWFQNSSIIRDQVFP